MPEVLNYNDDHINKSIDIQYFTSNTLDIISNFVASLLLGLLSYIFVLNMSVTILISGLYFFYKIDISKIKNQSINEDNTENEIENSS